MTLKEIQRLIDIAAATPIEPDGTSEYFNLLPRVYYSDLPEKLKKVADKITIDTAKRFLLECYPVGELEAMAANKTAFNDMILEALHTARYLIESTNTAPPKKTGNATEDLSPVSLIGADFVEAWEKVIGDYQKRDQLDGQETLFKEEEPVKRGGLAKSIINPNGLLLQHFLPMLNGNPTNVLMGISQKYLEADKITGTAIYTTKDGQTIRAKDFSEISAHLGTTAKKLLDTSVLYLTNDNYYRTGGTVVPTVIIHLEDFWRAQGHPIDAKNDTPKEQARIENLEKGLKKTVRADCKALQSLTWEGFTGTGKGKEQEAGFNFISGWRFLRDNRLKINFDIDLATYLVHAYQMQFPVVLLALDNRKPNSYVIGRKIALHHSMDSNAAAGTNNTISVVSLLNSAPEIPSYETVTAKRQGGWKTRIKQKLEAALDDLVKIGHLEKWEYRNPKAKNITTYTADTASDLSWDEYYKLVVDFTVKAEPDQTERRARRAAEKAAAVEKAKDKPKRKRGRPKKTAETG